MITALTNAERAYTVAVLACGRTSSRRPDFGARGMSTRDIRAQIEELFGNR